VKIADFGMSFKVAHDNDVVTKFVGTPIFMSPEMLLEQICCKKVFSSNKYVILSLIYGLQAAAFIYYLQARGHILILERF